MGVELIVLGTVCGVFQTGFVVYDTAKFLTAKSADERCYRAAMLAISTLSLAFTAMGVVGGFTGILPLCAIGFIGAIGQILRTFLFKTDPDCQTGHVPLGYVHVY